MDDYRLQQATPHNIEAEQALLGILLCDPNTYGEVEGRLKATDFYDGAHQVIYAAIVNLQHGGELATAAAIDARIHDNEGYRKLKGRAFLEMAADKAPPSTMVGHYCGLILDAFARREIVRLGESLRSQAQRGDTKVEEIVCYGEGALHRVSVGAGWVDHVADGAMMYQDVCDVLSGEGAPAYLSTGLLTYDARIGGLQMARMNIMAARAKMGKTAVAVVIGKNVAGRETSDGRQVGVHMFSHEMDRRELALRGSASMAFRRDDPASPVYAIAAKGQMRGVMADRMLEGARAWRDLCFTVDARAGMTIGQIEIAAKAQMRAWEKKRVEPGLFIVDHLGLVKADYPTGNRVADTGAVSGGLRDLFKTLGVTGLVLSQIRREVDKRGNDDRRPEMSDLAWSGDIEQDAAQVTFIYRPEAYLRVPQVSDPDYRTKLLDYEDALERVRNRVFLINRANRMGASNEECEFGMDLGRNAMWELG